MSAPKWAVGMRRLMPGVYDDGKGGLHLDVAAVLRANGYADTEANRAQLQHAWGEWAREKGAELVHVDADPS